MNRRLHLITTCTRRKAGSVEDTVFPGDTSLDDAFDGWYRLIAQAARRPGRVLETGELYRGAHWLRARGIAARWPGIELWAMSAGLGCATIPIRRSRMRQRFTPCPSRRRPSGAH